MPGIITTANFPKALTLGVKLWWSSAAAGAPQFATQLFKRELSASNYEEYAQSVGLGVAIVKPEGAPISYDSMQQGFITRGTNVSYGLGIITTYEELKDNKYVELTKNRTIALRKAFDEARNINAANIYNRAFTAGYVGGDGATLLSTAHPNFTGGTWQNKLVVDSALSQASLEDMLTLMMSAKNDRGYIEPLMGESLIVSPYNKFTADRILKTPRAVGSANNDINPLNMKDILPGGVIMCPYLTSSGAWFIKTNAMNGMVYQDRESVNYWEDNDMDTRNFKVAAFERYAFLWVNPRGLFGSNAA